MQCVHRYVCECSRMCVCVACVCIGMCVNAVAYGQYLLCHTSQSVISHKWLHPTSVDLLDMPDTYCLTTHHTSLFTCPLPVGFLCLLSDLEPNILGPTIKHSAAEPNLPAPHLPIPHLPAPHLITPQLITPHLITPQLITPQPNWPVPGHFNHPYGCKGTSVLSAMVTECALAARPAYLHLQSLAVSCSVQSGDAGGAKGRGRLWAGGDSGHRLPELLQRTARHCKTLRDIPKGQDIPKGPAHATDRNKMQDSR